MFSAGDFGFDVFDYYFAVFLSARLPLDAKKAAISLWMLSAASTLREAASRTEALLIGLFYCLLGSFLGHFETVFGVVIRRLI